MRHQEQVGVYRTEVRVQGVRVRQRVSHIFDDPLQTEVVVSRFAARRLRDIFGENVGVKIFHFSVLSSSVFPVGDAEWVWKSNSRAPVSPRSRKRPSMKTIASQVQEGFNPPFTVPQQLGRLAIEPAEG